MRVLAIDPGPERSGYAVWDGARVLESGTDRENELLRRETLPIILATTRDERGIIMAIEQVACYGMPVGATVFETVFWSGRLAEWWESTTGREVIRLRFGDVALHHCQSRRAKESHVRQALIDRFGPPGTVKAQGPLYGVHGHAWSALALSVMVADTRGARIPSFLATLPKAALPVTGMAVEPSE